MLHCIIIYAICKLIMSLFINALHRKFIYKKDASDKSREDINVGESVSMNVAPLYFQKR